MLYCQYLSICHVYICVTYTYLYLTYIHPSYITLHPYYPYVYTYVYSIWNGQTLQSLKTNKKVTVSSTTSDLDPYADFFPANQAHYQYIGSG